MEITGEGSIYCALQGYEKSIRERKFRIAEAEDRIANLKNSLKNVLKENDELTLRRDKLKMDNEVANAKYQAESKKRIILQDKIAALDREHALLLKKLERKTKLMEAMKAFQESRLNHIESVKMDYQKRFRSIEAVNHLISLNEQIESKSEEIASKKDEIQKLKSNVEKMTENSTGNWNKFVKACLELAEVYVKNSLSNEDKLRNEFQPESQPISKVSPGDNETSNELNNEMVQESLRQLTRRGIKSINRSSGFHDTLERLRNTRRKLTSLSTSTITDKVVVTSVSASIVPSSAPVTSVSASIVPSSAAVTSVSASIVPSSAAVTSVSTSTVRGSAAVTSVSTSTVRGSAAVTSASTSTVRSSAAVTSVSTSTVPGSVNVSSMATLTVPGKAIETYVSTPAVPGSATVSSMATLIVPGKVIETSMSTPAVSGSAAVTSVATSRSTVPTAAASFSFIGACHNDEVFKVPPRPPAVPMKPNSLVSKASSIGTDKSAGCKSTTTESPQVPSFLNFGEDFTTNDSGFLDIFGSSDKNATGNVDLSASGYDFDNILFGSNSSGEKQRSFF